MVQLIWSYLLSRKKNRKERRICHKEQISTMMCEKCGHDKIIHKEYQTPAIKQNSIICMEEDCFCYEIQ